ncbi:hypothetical protein GCM10009530_17650 [Microbispora corallina]|nr:DUF6286 domain-containing protein [Microbispora corallina]
MSVVQEILAGSTAVHVQEERRPPRRDGVRALRPGRRPAAVAVSAALALTGWAATVEAIASMMDRPIMWPAVRRLLATTYAHPAVPAVAVAMILAGAGLVALAVVPGRPRLVPIAADDPLLVIGLTRAGLRRTLSAAARDVEGVRRAQVRILRGRIEVTVVTGTQRVGDLLREVGAAVGDRLSGLGAQGRYEVVVRLRGRRA